MDRTVSSPSPMREDVPASARPSAVATALGAAILFTLLLNAPSFWIALQGDLTLPNLAPSVDEQYYAAQIANIGRGGNEEYPPRGSFAPAVQGIVLRLLPMRLATSLFLGDLLFPFGIVLLLSLGLRNLLASPILAAAAALTILGQFGLGWLRTVNPEITFLPIVSYIAVLFLLRSSIAQYVLRGMLLGVMLFTHIIHASFFCIFEGCDALRRIFARPEERRDILQHVVVLGAVSLFFLLLFLFATHGEAPALATADTLRRSGLIRSRLPAAPFLQGLLLVAGMLLLIVRRKARNPAETSSLLLTLTVAGILVLNQSLLHGMDAIFGLYYQPIILLIVGMSVAYVLRRMLSRQVCVSLFLLLVFLTFFPLVRAIPDRVREMQRQNEAWHASPIPALMIALQDEPRTLTILGPLDVANLIPVFTRHRVLFNKYALYRWVSDAELARRYALQEALFPTSTEARGEGYNSVFGLAAGNLAARGRTLCEILNVFRRRERICRAPIASFVQHQDVLQWLDRVLKDPSSLDLTALLREFHVDRIVMQEPALPTALLQLCPEERRIGSYVLYRCREA